MIVCPVCEHAQAQGSECDVCGRAFPRGLAREVPVERLPGLEVTGLGADVDPSALRAPVAPIEGLELTPLRSGPDLPVAPIQELERAAEPTVGAVPVIRLGELEVHREDPAADAERTVMPAPGAPLTCRFCRNVQAEGLVCDRCGMRLTRYMNDPSTSSAASPTSPPARRAEAPMILHKCGVRTRAGARCSSCGAFVPHPDAP